jgi:hypothetical protein
MGRTNRQTFVLALVEGGSSHDASICAQRRDGAGMYLGDKRPSRRGGVRSGLDTLVQGRGDGDGVHQSPRAGLLGRDEGRNDGEVVGLADGTHQAGAGRERSEQRWKATSSCSSPPHAVIAGARTSVLRGRASTAYSVSVQVASRTRTPMEDLADARSVLSHVYGLREKTSDAAQPCRVV